MDVLVAQKDQVSKKPVDSIEVSNELSQMHEKLVRPLKIDSYQIDWNIVFEYLQSNDQEKQMYALEICEKSHEGWARDIVDPNNKIYQVLKDLVISGSVEVASKACELFQGVAHLEDEGYRLAA